MINIRRRRRRLRLSKSKCANVNLDLCHFMCTTAFLIILFLQSACNHPDLWAMWKLV